MSKKSIPSPPESLLSARPILNEELEVQHPETMTASAGSPPKGYTRGLHDMIVKYVEEGHHLHVAAGMAGITRATLERWLKLGQEGNPHLAAFASDVELAETRAEGEALSVVRKELTTENAKWLLERRFGKRWAKVVKQQVDQQLHEMADLLEKGLPLPIFEWVAAVMSGQPYMPPPILAQAVAKLTQPEITVIPDSETDR